MEELSIFLEDQEAITKLYVLGTQSDADLPLLQQEMREIIDFPVNGVSLSKEQHLGVYSHAVVVDWLMGNSQHKN